MSADEFHYSSDG